MPQDGGHCPTDSQPQHPMPAGPPKRRLLDDVRAACQVRRLSPRTEDADVGWVRRFVIWSGTRHPNTMGEIEVAGFLSMLATRRQVSASTQNQALSALLFLYRAVLGRDLQGLTGIVRAHPPSRLPVVLSREEVRRVFAHLRGAPRLVALLLYGSGLRLAEALELRVKDLDFDRGEITVRRGKGAKDRRTMLAAGAASALREHLVSVRARHRADLALGPGRVVMPDALGRKYHDADRSWSNKGGLGVRSPADSL